MAFQLRRNLPAIFYRHIDVEQDKVRLKFKARLNGLDGERLIPHDKSMIFKTHFDGLANRQFVVHDQNFLLRD